MLSSCGTPAPRLLPVCLLVPLQASDCEFEKTLSFLSRPWCKDAPTAAPSGVVFFFIARQSFYLTSCKLLRAVEAIKLPSFTFTEVESQCSARRMKQFPPFSIKYANGAARLRTSEAWSSPGLKRCARYSKVYKGSHVGSLNFRGDGQESKSPEEEGNVALIFSIQWGLGWVGRGHVSISSIKRCCPPHPPVIFSNALQP